MIEKQCVLCKKVFYTRNKSVSKGSRRGSGYRQFRATTCSKKHSLAWSRIRLRKDKQLYPGEII
jgi:hypothetical protein